MILFGVLLAVVLGAVWLWMTQGNNIKALYLAIRNDKDTLAQIQQEQDKKQDEILKEFGELYQERELDHLDEKVERSTDK